MFSRSSLVLLAMISGYVGAFIVPRQHLQQHNNQRFEAGGRANTRMMAPALASAYSTSPGNVPRSWKDKNTKTVCGGGFRGAIGKLGQELMAPYTESRKEGDVARTFFSNTKDNVGGSANKAKDSASDVANKASNSASDAADTVSNKARDAANTVGDKVKGSYRSASDATKDAAENAHENAKGLYGSAKDNVGDVANAAKDAAECVRLREREIRRCRQCHQRRCQ